MSTASSILKTIRRICLVLPDTVETMTWGKPHFRAKDKIFAGFGEKQGEPVIEFKLESAHAKSIIKNPRFTPAPYVGHKGWVSMTLQDEPSWDEVRGLILESYRLIAPKRSLAKFDSVIAK